MLEAEAPPPFGEVVELPRLPPSRHRQVVGGRTQVLADRGDRHADGRHVGQRLFDLVGTLPESDHQTGLRGEAGAHAARQDGERAQVPGARSNGALQSRDRLDVVVQDVGPRVDDQLQRRGVTLEVAGEDLDVGLGRAFAYRANRRRDRRRRRRRPGRRAPRR